MDCPLVFPMKNHSAIDSETMGREHGPSGPAPQWDHCEQVLKSFLILILILSSLISYLLLSYLLLSSLIFSYLLLSSLSIIFLSYLFLNYLYPVFCDSVDFA